MISLEKMKAKHKVNDLGEVGQREGGRCPPPCRVGQVLQPVSNTDYPSVQPHDSVLCHQVRLAIKHSKSESCSFHIQKIPRAQNKCDSQGKSKKAALENRDDIMMDASVARSRSWRLKSRISIRPF